MRQSGLDFRALLPDSISGDPTIMALAESVGQELRATAALGDLVRVKSRLDELTEPVLSLLAWEYNVVFWDAALPDATKRTLIRQAIRWRRIHGTPACVEEACSVVFGEPARVVNWNRYGGEPGRFRVEVEITEAPLEPDLPARALEVIRVTKNMRSHLDELRVVITSRGYIRMPCVMQPAITLDVRPWTPTETDLNCERRVACGVHVVATLNYGQ